MLASSSNAGIRRALKKLNRKARNKYSLEHVRGYQDRTVRFDDLWLEAQLNVKCDTMAKEAVKGSMTRKLRDKRQQLPLETVCVIISGRKQTLDPKKGLKRQIGTVQTKAYYISRGKGKGGMDVKVFDMIAWNDV